VEYAQECVTTPVVVGVLVPPGVCGTECGDRLLVPGAAHWEGVLGGSWPYMRLCSCLRRRSLPFD
jgi:hypothetical protein